MISVLRIVNKRCTKTDTNICRWTFRL